MSRLFSGTPFDRPPICPTCGKSQSDCRCIALPPKKKSANPNKLDSGLILTPRNAKPPSDQLAKIRIEKRKGNRHVTLITGLDHPPNDLPALCTALKQSLGVGGSIQGRTIELQGEKAHEALQLLAAKNLKARIL